MTSQTLNWFRRAEWLNAERVSAYARIFIGILTIASIYWVARSKGLIDEAGHPLGTDFLNVYAAGLLADRGMPASVYDWPTHKLVEASVIPYEGYFGWHYPPMFLFVAAPLAVMPYVGALVVYLALTFGAYLLAMRRLGGFPDAVWLAAGFPAVFVNLGHGQNGFLTTALLTTGIAYLTSRPLLAGLAFGCLVYKPQFALLLPIALLAGGHWRTVVSAGITAFGLALASLLAFGTSTWRAFFASLEPTRTIILEQGATGWQKIVSVFSAIRMLGGSIDAAYAIQSAMTLTAIVIVGIVWWRSRRIGLAAGCLALAIPLTTPYVLDYDLVVLAVAVMILAQEGIETGFRPWEKLALGLVTIGPLFARGIGGALHIPITPPILAATLVLFAMRTVAEHLESGQRLGRASD